MSIRMHRHPNGDAPLHVVSAVAGLAYVGPIAGVRAAGGSRWVLDDPMTGPQEPSPHDRIADTGMFQRFVAEPEPVASGSGRRTIVWVVAIVVLLALIALLFFLLR